MVGGVLRTGSSVGVIEGVKVGSKVMVMVGSGVIVEVGENIGMTVSVAGIGVGWGAGAQVEMARSIIKIVKINGFMGVPPVHDWIVVKRLRLSRCSVRRKNRQ